MLARISAYGFASVVFAFGCTWNANSEIVDFKLQKNFDMMTQAEHTAAKKAALTRQFQNIVACADPGNMPMSNIKEEGFQNKIMRVVAKHMNTTTSFFWRPFLQRGLTRETFANKECRVIVGMPTDSAELLTTIPIYRSTYVFAYRNDGSVDKIKDLDDPQLKEKRVGVFQHSGMREALRRHGIQESLDIHILSYDADLKTEKQPWRQAQRVIKGELDIAGIWGPFAGWLVKQKGADITLQPANVLEHETPLEFSLSIGMQKSESVLKYAMDNALEKAKPEIEAILRAYGVPLVECSKCIVQGDLPSHGSYYKRFLQDAKTRYVETIPAERMNLTDAATPDQVVTQKRLETWLEEGADLNMELENAVNGSDAERIRFLVSKGSDVNHLDKHGAAPIHTAAKVRDTETVKLLLELGAKVDLEDRDGWTALFHAVHRNHIPTVEALAKAGADVERKDRNNVTPLALALDERNFYAVKALLDADVSMSTRIGPEQITPLMVVVTQAKAFSKLGRNTEGIDPVKIAEAMIEKGADVNAKSRQGITALMIAAGFDNSAMIGLLYKYGADLEAKNNQGKTALDIAKHALNDSAIKSINLFKSLSKQKPKNAKGAQQGQDDHSIE